MKNRLTGVLIFFILGGSLLLGGKWLLPYFQEKQQKATSDASYTEGEITIAVDNWIGYFPLCSKEMRKRMHRNGWLLQCEDDRADYSSRMSRLAANKIDFAVVTVDSYLLNANKFNYPGAIVMVIDESKGGDAIVAKKEKAANLDAIRDTNNLRIAFTPNSPSHHLLKAAADHFNLPGLLPKEKQLRIETEGSEGALKEILSGNADVAVLWEPDVSKALSKKDIIKLLGTEETERLIVDILVVNREFMQKSPEAVSMLMGTYFKTLKNYRDNPSDLLEDLIKETKLKKKAAKSMLSGVHWVSLTENSEKWFGIAGPAGYADELITDTIDSSADILVHAGDFSSSPIPNQDSYRLIKRSFLEDLFLKGVSGFTTPGKKNAANPRKTNSLETKFAPLHDGDWDRLAEVGTLKIKPIIFSRGSIKLDLMAQHEIDLAVKKLAHYPHFRVLIKGHTGTRGDHEANLLLSRQRADAVTAYLQSRFNIDSNRLKSVGFGAQHPLKRQDGEAKRAYEQRLLRVELVLVREEL